MRYVTCLVFAACLVFFAAWQSHHLSTVRRAGLPEAYAGYSAQTPPALTFVMAGLGGFRGIVSEVLWFRAHRLQEEGRFLELVQLADWITRLDPHASEAWIYNAWNLTYNVSVMMIRETDRLRWVKNGIVLLRDDAVRFNPREARLYRELAWIYQNKIGDSLDAAHLVYKLDLARAMAPLLNPDGTVNLKTTDLRSRLADQRLDLDQILALQQQFGLLDWRLAETHAVYWASRGLMFATGTERLMCRRAVYQALLISVFRGQFDGSLDEGCWQTRPHVVLAMPAALFLEETLTAHPSKNMQRVYLHAVARIIQLLDHYEQKEDGMALYRGFVKHLPADMPVPTWQDVIAGWQP